MSRKPQTRKLNPPKLFAFQGLNRILEEDDKGCERMRVEQVVKGGCVYHPTKGWRRKSAGFNSRGHMKILRLIGRKPGDTGSI